MEHLVTTIWQYGIDARMPETLPAPTPHSQVSLSPCSLGDCSPTGAHRMAEPGECGAGAPGLHLRTRASAPDVCSERIQSGAKRYHTRAVPCSCRKHAQGRRIPDERKHCLTEGPMVCLTLQLPVWHHEQVLREEVLA